MVTQQLAAKSQALSLPAVRASGCSCCLPAIVALGQGPGSDRESNPSLRGRLAQRPLAAWPLGRLATAWPPPGRRLAAWLLGRLAAWLSYCH